MHGYCPTCRTSHVVAERFGATAGIALAGMLVGSRVHPVVMLLAGLAGAAAGRTIDEELARRCPECRTVLLVAAALT